MLPSARRQRRTRLWSLVAAGLALLVAGLFGWLAAGDAGALALWLGGGALAAGGVYALGMRRLWHRRRLLREELPEAWHRVLSERVAFYARLEVEEQERFRRLAQVFLDEFPVTGVGCEVDQTGRLLVAASAVIPVFRFADWEYDMLDEVLVYPHSFNSCFEREPASERTALGMVATAGLANGVMILSLPDLEQGFAVHGDRANVGIHEFAHLVDKATGHVDGVPAGLAPGKLGPWIHLVGHELRGAGAGRDLPAYGYTSEPEFFAVVSECFFENPDQLQNRHPELYGFLEGIYRQNPRRRFRGLARRLWQPVRKRVGRNQPCPCGSGEKYKRCCGR